MKLKNILVIGLLYDAMHIAYVRNSVNLIKFKKSILLVILKQVQFLQFIFLCFTLSKIPKYFDFHSTEQDVLL